VIHIAVATSFAPSVARAIVARSRDRMDLLGMLTGAYEPHSP
jgi:hypothetical protein